jgi:GntR family transcriptional regulator/MocR family aminotransferase
VAGIFAPDRRRPSIVSAFELLKSEGYLRGTIGSGTHVSMVLPDALLQVTRTPGPESSPYRRKKRSVSDYGKRVVLFPSYEIRPSRAFRANVPALDLFPTTLWAQLTARRLRRASRLLLLGCDPMGYGPLRDAVANYLSTSRGVKCGPEQIAIVSGVQEALDLTARLLLNPGDGVCMENPGFIGARMAFEAFGAKVRAVDLDDEGMKLRGQNLRDARLVYVTPGHQFPLGITMSLPRRLELLEWARKSGALIF